MEKILTNFLTDLSVSLGKSSLAFWYLMTTLLTHAKVGLQAVVGVLKVLMWDDYVLVVEDEQKIKDEIVNGLEHQQMSSAINCVSDKLPSVEKMARQFCIADDVLDTIDRAKAATDRGRETIAVSLVCACLYTSVPKATTKDKRCT